jgi:diguanylate cyclase (GGDEF)-like protein/PAS domain S-box-containing protein
MQVKPKRKSGTTPPRKRDTSAHEQTPPSVSRCAPKAGSISAPSLRNTSEMLTLFPENFFKIRRHSRLAVGLFLVMMLASLVIGYSVYSRMAESEARQITQTLNHIADIQAAAVSSWVTERLSDAAVFGSGRFLGETMHQWIARGEPDDDMRQQIMEQLQAIKNTFNYQDVAVVDTSGNIRMSTYRDNRPLDPTAARTVDAAIASNSTQISTIHAVDPSSPRSQRIVDIATPLLNVHERNAKVPSILLLQANAGAHLESLVQSIQLLSASVEVYLAEARNGQLVVTASNQGAIRFRAGQTLPVEVGHFTSALQDQNGHFLMSSEDAVNVSVARRIAGVPWFLVAAVDREASRSAAEQLAWIVVGVTAGLLSLLGVAILLWWKERESGFRFQALQAETERKRLQRQYDYLSKYANDMIILADADACIIEINDKTLQMLGRDRSNVLGGPLDSLFLPSSRQALEDALGRLRNQGVAIFELEQKDADGRVVPVEASARAIELGKERFIQLVCRDITERRQSETALRESEERMNAILASIVDVVWSFSPHLEKMHYINQSAESLYGHPASAFIAHPRLWLELIHPEDRPKVEETMSAMSADHPRCDAEYRIIRRDGQMRWVNCRGTLVLDREGKALRIDGVSTDVTSRKTAELQVQTLAYYDNVTMLPNRALLQDRLAQAMHMALRSHKKVALLYMDLDNFKHINDSLGHHVGDMLLRAIAERLLQCVREEDTVARIGGDEFLVVLPDIDQGRQTVAVAEKILAAASRPFALHGQQIHSTISIGISVYPDDAQEPHELIRHADSALYQAKGLGRDNYQFFTRELNYQITRSSTIERQLREAIDAGHLSLSYQPQIDTRSGQLVGAEALLRWRGNDGDFLSPAEFIPVAEERGLIARIGDWAMREACMQSRRWQLKGLKVVPIAVNVSPIQFQQKDFADRVIDILDEFQIAPYCLELEITEGAIMRRAPQVAALAMRLREVGVGISIDDFGTGYSSLSYLKQIPIDKIKIDRSFIADMLEDADDDAITFAIVNLARSLKLRVIAEGVESKEQVDRLHLFGCNEVQGHYYCSAVSADIFERFLIHQGGFLRAAPPLH